MPQRAIRFRQEPLSEKTLTITTGDPSGIGPEVLFRALRGIETTVPIRIYGSWELARAGVEPEQIDPRIAIVPPEHHDELSPEEPLAFVDLGTGPDPEDFAIGRVSQAGGRAALAAIDAAVSSIERGNAAALVTAPINKAAIRMAGATEPGHTEILATRAGLGRYAHDYAMYFDSPTLKVALLTVHVPLREVIASITAENVTALARLVDREIGKLDRSRPRIAVAGLNPHAGEGGLFGDEEKRIADGVREARSDGIEIEGPLPPDTVFHSARQGRFDVVIAAYHDQGLIPVKTLHFHEAVNVTLGLPYLRASVDHGTAFDIAGKGVADPTAMKFAVEWTLEKMSR